jgi:hypothetical protein
MNSNCTVIKEFIIDLPFFFKKMLNKTALMTCILVVTYSVYSLYLRL